jgi:hypothetical protein
VAEEGECCDQRTGAGARDDLECVPRARLGPAHQQTRTEGAVAAPPEITR